MEPLSTSCLVLGIDSMAFAPSRRRQHLLAVALALVQVKVTGGMPSRSGNWKVTWPSWVGLRVQVGGLGDHVVG